MPPPRCNSLIARVLRGATFKGHWNNVSSYFRCLDAKIRGEVCYVNKNRHTEDYSPKYRMVGNDVGLESQTHRSFKFWYRDFCSSLRANAKQSSLLNRLRNKCAMTDYGHPVSVSCGLNPSPAFQAPSAQGREGHTHRTALRFPLSPQVAREKFLLIRSTHYSPFTY